MASFVLGRRSLRTRHHAGEPGLHGHGHHRPDRRGVPGADPSNASVARTGGGRAGLPAGRHLLLAHLPTARKSEMVRDRDEIRVQIINLIFFPELIIESCKGDSKNEFLKCIFRGVDVKKSEIRLKSEISVERFLT